RTCCPARILQVLRSSTAPSTSTAPEATSALPAPPLSTSPTSFSSWLSSTKSPSSSKSMPGSWSAMRSTIQRREHPFQVDELGRVVVDDVWLVRMVLQVVLVVGLGGVESVQWGDPGDDRCGEDMRRLQLGDVGLGDALLLPVRREDLRTVLRPDVGTLAVELGRIVDDREEHLEQLPVA